MDSSAPSLTGYRRANDPYVFVTNVINSTFSINIMKDLTMNIIVL